MKLEKTVIVDAFGGDNAPDDIVKGSVMARSAYGVRIVLVGEPDKIQDSIRRQGLSLDGLEIAPAQGVIGMHDDPGEILKSKSACSMAEGLRLLATGRGDAFVSAGSTGALVVGATFIVKRIRGIRRAALGVVVPTPQGQYLLIDSGANVEGRSDMLESFAMMGCAYVERVLGVPSPRVGLLNVGVEDTKGGALQLETYARLKKSKLNFIGNVEARDVPGGICDVLVCDGFTGNIVLKMTEGVAVTLMAMVKGVLLATPITKLAAMMIKKRMNHIKQQMDYDEHGGAPLLGVAKPVIKAHGSSGARAIQNAIRQAAEFAASGAVETISHSVGRSAEKNSSPTSTKSEESLSENKR